MAAGSVETPTVSDESVKAEIALWQPVARDLAITNEQEATEAGNALAEIKAIREKIDLLFTNPKTGENLIQQAHRLWNGLTSRRKSLLDPLEAIEKSIKAKIGAFVLEDQRKKREAAEAARREEEQRVAAEARALREAEEARRAAEAEALKQAGHAEEAKAVMEAPVVVAAPTPVAIVEAPKASIGGAAAKKKYVARVVDESKIPDNYWLLDMQAINAVVRAMGPNHGIPGVVAEEDITIAAPSRKSRLGA